jgi:hypothetical protein
MIEIRRLGPQIGAEIRGVDVRGLDDAGFAAIYRAWLDHNVVVVPGQALEIEDFLRYSRRFGRVVPHPSKMTRHPDHPEITLLGVNKFGPGDLGAGGGAGLVRRPAGRGSPGGRAGRLPPLKAPGGARVVRCAGAGPPAIRRGEVRQCDRTGSSRCGARGAGSPWAGSRCLTGSPRR